MNSWAYLKSFLFGSSDKPSQFDPDGILQPIYNSFIYDSKTKFNDSYEEKRKLNDIFNSPALLKVISLQCDLFSLGKVYVYQDEKDIGEDPGLTTLENPNPFQSGYQLLWDYMFWLMTGNAYCYFDSDIPGSSTNKVYFLDTSKIEFPDSLLKNSDKLIFSKKAEKEMLDTIIRYKYDDGTSIEFPLSKITVLSDLTNGLGNRFRSNSRITALHKIIYNSEATLDATNINIRYTGKFIVAGTTDPNDVSKKIMGEEEKKDIEDKVNKKHKQVYGMKSMIEIKRFVENLANLKLPEMYASQYYFIAAMYGIPKDVAEAYWQSGATFENQEKATGKYISYTLQPKGDDFMNGITKRWGYKEQGKKFVISWDHLPFMQVFEKDRASVQQTKVSTLSSLLKLGVPIQEANEFLDLNFTIDEQQREKANPPKGGQGA